jgi:transcriptional regulator with XRE-family HTH domain/anti-sigma regulatory factor (Ser/Thr protein kinase)
MADASVISLAERLKSRREELGMSQSQAARELDVARTAYRLWELEAAKPAPDRWRLIASWLGVSVTTMLLAENLVTEDEAAVGDIAAFNFGIPARASGGTGEVRGFFDQARGLIADGIKRGDITAEHAQDLTFLVERIESERSQVETPGWEATELRKTLQTNETAPRTAREALSFVGADLPAGPLETARLLVSELVTNSVVHGPPGPSRSIGLFVSVERNVLRVEVSDDSPQGAVPKASSEDGGFGLTFVAAMSSRWGSGRSDGLNVTWFELDVPLPGATLGA